MTTRSTKCHLGWKGCVFLMCLGMSSVYIWVTRSTETRSKVKMTPCRPFHAHCRDLLAPNDDPTEWHRRDCRIKSYITNSKVDCSNLRKDLHFITSPLSAEEEAYPLAFILTVHKELEVLVRLLRAIYAPQNLYCVHIDAKSPPEYRNSLRKLSDCLENVFLSTRSETVVYGGFSRLQADLNCMGDLVKSKVGWRKVINLCGQDYPLMSNLELVRYLQDKMWRDKNMTPGIKQPEHIKWRTQFQHNESHVYFVQSKVKKGPPPHNMQIFFGTAYYALTRGFVDFVLENPKARDLLEWSRDTYSPDEHYWVTLNHLTEAPGNNIGGGWTGGIRAIKWADQFRTKHKACNGRYVRGICVYGFEDLPWLIKKGSMFANKFENDFQPEALDCLEQWHRNKLLSNANVPIESSWLLATPREMAP
ncbi:putative beta-1,3-galactosyl-O-glycosyl-glycoprotein beta-1,6-N-acetylglucosaminyltransferase 7 [Stigmatopora nigra]